VIRGDDHISNTPRQILLDQAFGWTPPRFAHVPMILGSDGTRLSKRHGATSVAAYADLGFLPAAMVNFLALLGWSFDGTRELFTLRELEEAFTLDRVGSNPAVFNIEKLEWMNGQHLKRLSDEERTRLAVEFLRTRGHDLSARPDAWRARLVRAIGDRMKTLMDVERYDAWAFLDAIELDPAAWEEAREKPDAGPRLEALADRLERDPEYTLESLERITRGLASELGIKAGDLMMIARVALTGRKVAPGLFEVMTLLGKDRAVSRLRDASARMRAGTEQGRV